MRPLAFVGGAAAIGVMVVGFLWWTRGAHVELRGEIKKIRTGVLEEKASIAIIDFRFRNPSDHPFVVRSVDLILEQGDKSTPGMVIAEADARQMFQALPVLGQMFNDSLKIRDKIGSRQESDRMVAARFEVPESELTARTRFRVRVEEIDGGVSEIVEAR